jgi:hypothetical protein
VIELKADFTAVSLLNFQWLNYISLSLFKARLQRGNLLLKQGDFNEAKADFEYIVC